MKSTCFLAAVAAVSSADAFFHSPRMSGDVLAPFKAGKALKVRYVIDDERGMVIFWTMF